MSLSLNQNSHGKAPALIEDSMKGGKISYIQNTMAELKSTKTALYKFQFIGIVSGAGSVENETAELLKPFPKVSPIVVFLFE